MIGRATVMKRFGSDFARREAPGSGQTTHLSATTTGVLVNPQMVNWLTMSFLWNFTW